MKDVCRNLTTNKWFELTIIVVNVSSTKYKSLEIW